MVGYLVVEKAGMPFNAFYSQPQRVGLHRVVDRSGPSANGGKGIRTAGRNYNGLIRGTNVFVVDESGNSLLSER